MTNILQEKRVGDLHPGTINFNARLEEAQRIHRDNMILAARLDRMQPYYKREKFMTAKKIGGGKKKPLLIPKLKLPRNTGGRGDDDILTERSSQVSKDKKGVQKSQSARKPEKNQDNPVKVLLEYTKLQNGKVLDVAVIKVSGIYV